MPQSKDNTTSYCYSQNKSTHMRVFIEFFLIVTLESYYPLQINEMLALSQLARDILLTIPLDPSVDIAHFVL
jgi:hypothetical protein